MMKNLFLFFIMYACKFNIFLAMAKILNVWRKEMSENKYKIQPKTFILLYKQLE